MLSLKELLHQAGLKERLTELSKDKIFCLGDPIIDCYSVKDSSDIKIFPGGALNVFANITSISGNGYYLDPVLDLLVNSSELELFFTNLVSGRTDYGKYSKSLFLPSNTLIKINSKYNNYLPVDTYLLEDLKIKTLVLSDYCRGSLLSCSNSLTADVVIVDSKKRSLDLDIIGSGIKIWHATGKEYTDFWAKNFHYVFHTNGSEPVKIINVKDKTVIFTLPVPQTKIISTCGAGDTFVAAISAYIHKHFNSSEDNFESLLREAGLFAIECCQDVISQPYTSITKHTLG
jgi:hypothetical protein